MNLAAPMAGKYALVTGASGGLGEPFARLPDVELSSQLVRAAKIGSAFFMSPMPFPVPAELCTLTSAGRRVAWAKPSATATTDASRRPRMY